MEPRSICFTAFRKGGLVDSTRQPHCLKERETRTPASVPVRALSASCSSLLSIVTNSLSIAMSIVSLRAGQTEFLDACDKHVLTTPILLHVRKSIVSSAAIKAGGGSRSTKARDLCSLQTSFATSSSTVQFLPCLYLPASL
ncbi:hypothetical protein HRR84_000812 [Exophiala dermatitidis]|nr:hypothetical protein HRR84_000812 [Exophiala dermatitidis]KAJ9004566.1 hypothetical protein HRR94_000272 [Exophiala dermatitidis]